MVGGEERGSGEGLPCLKDKENVTACSSASVTIPSLSGVGRGRELRMQKRGGETSGAKGWDRQEGCCLPTRGQPTLRPEQWGEVFLTTSSFFGTRKRCHYWTGGEVCVLLDGGRGVCGGRGDVERGKVGSGRVALADVPPTSGMESSVLLLTQEHVWSIVHVCLQSPEASLGTASWHSIV